MSESNGDGDPNHSTEYRYRDEARSTSGISPRSVERGLGDGETRADDEDVPVEGPLHRHLTVIGVLNLVTAALLFIGPVLWAVAVGGEAVLWLPILLLLLAIPVALHTAAGLNCLRRDGRAGLIISIVTSGLVLAFLAPAALRDLPATFSGDSTYRAWDIVAGPAWYGAILWLSIDSLRRSGGERSTPDRPSPAAG